MHLHLETKTSNHELSMLRASVPFLITYKPVLDAPELGFTTRVPAFRGPFRCESVNWIVSNENWQVVVHGRWGAAKGRGCYGPNLLMCVRMRRFSCSGVGRVG